jgi:hypothetical protein
MLTAETSERARQGFDPQRFARIGSLTVSAARFVEYAKVLGASNEARNELVVCVIIPGGLGVRN